MSNDKTLATVKHGGCVQLPSTAGQDAAVEAMAACLHCAESSASLEDAREQAKLLLSEALPHLSAQPSPGGQDSLTALVAKWRAAAAEHELLSLEADSIGLTVAAMRNDARHQVLEAAADELEAALVARQPVGATVKDSLTVGGGQAVGEPVTVEAVAAVRRWSNGDRYIDWLTEGGISDLEAGDVLMVADRAITDEDGSGEVYTAPPAQAGDLGPASIPDTQEVRDILGRPNFWCSPWANVLRMRGDAIPRKAEEEQAAVIRFMLNHYLANGADWAETAGAELDAIRKADSQAVGK